MEDNNLDNLTKFEEDDSISMADLLGPETKTALNKGQILEVVIVAETDDGFMVDLGMKSEGIIPKSEFENNEIPKELAVGATVKVFVKNAVGRIQLSYREVLEKQAWDTIEETFKNKQTIKGTIKKSIKGGFIVDVGVNAFLHISQVDTVFVNSPEKYIGKNFEFAITEFNRYDKKITLSRRKLLEDEKRAKKAKMFETLTEGQILDGTVKKIIPSAAFVDLGGVDGFLHIGELAWYKVKKVEDILHVGQIVRVQISKIDKENEKISLSMKQLAVNPWDTAGEKYIAGLIMKGKVTSIMPYGAFVELEKGVEGLLPISEYAWNDSEHLFKKEVKEGQDIEVKIVSCDKDTKKISLSVKQMKPNPWEVAARHYIPGAKVKGTVKNITPFGAFVKLPEGVEGLIHISDFSWLKNVKHPEDVVKKDQEIEAVVLSVNTQTEKIALSIKHLTEDPYKKYKLGTTVKGKVVRVTEFGVFIEAEPNIEVLIKKTELSFENKIGELPKEGEEIEAKIIKSDLRERKLEASIKKFEKAQEKELIKQFSSNDEKPTLGDILQEEE
ncbi:MAG: S1 RNA-binding domain-containing protein [Endomicrobiaceae bacterium]|nr:S1 RNA-binding domain-containing protein [Endomicrobiaceae bacterium]